MKKSCYSMVWLALFLGLSLPSFSQNGGIFYQAVARNASGNLLFQELLQVRFTIEQGGSQVYQGNQTVTTSEYGLFSVIIGADDPVSFSSIDWNDAPASLKVEINDGSGYVDLGVTDFQHVPYSKVATDMEINDLKDVSTTPPNNGQVLKWNGTEWAAAEDESGSDAIGPIAFGFVQNDGTISSGTGNFTASWDATSNRYEIGITGESYFFSSYATNVTTIESNVHRIRTGSVGGNLLVYLYDSAGNLVQGRFQFVTFKP